MSTRTLPRPPAFRPQYFTAHETTRMKELEGKRLASFRARTLAIVLDGGLVLLILFLLLLGYIYRHGHPLHGNNLSFSTQLTNDYEFSINGKKIGWMSYVIEFGIPVFYWGLLTYFWNGRTPGKWIAGIRVVSTGHEKIRLWQSIERALGYSVSALELGFGFLQYFISPNRRATHDRLAETIVICDASRPALERGARIWKSKISVAKKLLKEF